MRAFRTSLVLLSLLPLSACGARTVLNGEGDDAAVQPDVPDAGNLPVDVPSTPVDVPVIGVDIPKIGVDVPFNPFDVPVITPDVPVIEVDVPVTPVDVPVIGVDVPVIGVDVPVIGVDVPVIGVDAPTPGLTCESAEPLLSDSVVSVTYPAGGAALPACAGSTLAGGNIRWFTVVVPPQAQLLVSPEGGVVPLLRAFSDCRSVPTCLASNLGPAGTSLSWSNPGSTDARIAAVIVFFKVVSPPSLLFSPVSKSSR